MRPFSCEAIRDGQERPAQFFLGAPLPNTEFEICFAVERGYVVVNPGGPSALNPVNLVSGSVITAQAFLWTADRPPADSNLVTYYMRE